MTTLLNTLLASLFTALFGTLPEEPVNSSLSKRIEVTVKEDPKTHCDLKIYFYQSV